jgi:myo-inositol-1(or 4)-monophosphatase
MNREETKIARQALETARRAARAAGEVIRRGSAAGFRVDRKGATDLVTEVDLAAEKTVIAVISNAFPAHRIAAEESGRGEGDSDYLWWIDPIDGTTNFVHGYPFYSVSIALEFRGVMIAGVVYDPVQGELFEALRSGGARLNSRKITVSPVTGLADALLATGFPYERSERARALAMAAGFLPRIQGLRRDGSAALDLAYVAAGRLDGFWERGLKPWDTAAGALLVGEAGGRVSNLTGGKFDIHLGEIAAANPRIHLELISGLNQSRQ